MRRSHHGFIIAVCLLNSAVALAQSDAPAPVLAPPPAPPVVTRASGDPASNSLHEGVYGLSFQIPTGGSPWLTNSAGGWYMLTPRVNLGLFLNFGIDPQNAGTDTFVNVNFFLAPTVKYYFTTSGPVTPFFVGQLVGGFARVAGGTNTVVGANGVVTTSTGGNTSGALSLMGGFGLEVFPWRFLSLGGQIGVNLDLLRPGLQQRSAALQTLTSAMYATCYFE